MSATWSITKKELISYFTSPIAYIVIAIFILLSGFFSTAWSGGSTPQLCRWPRTPITSS